MKLAITFLAVFTVIANAVPKTRTIFTCKATEKSRPVTVKFLVEDLYGGHATLGVLPGGNENEPIVVMPNSSLLFQLNENLSFRDIKNGKLQIDGDADGFYSVTLILYENSKYEKGFVKVEGDENMYSKVSCRLATK